MRQMNYISSIGVTLVVTMCLQDGRLAAPEVLSDHSILIDLHASLGLILIIHQNKNIGELRNMLSFSLFYFFVDKKKRQS